MAESMCLKIAVVISLVFGLAGCLLPVSAATAHTHNATTRLVYELVQVMVADTQPSTFLWEVRQTAGPYASDTDPPNEVFPSLTSPDLRRWVSHLPPHSQINYTVGLEDALVRRDKAETVSAVIERVIGDAQRMTDDFSVFCKNKGMAFYVLGEAH
jgi:hypothetical protein